MRPLEFQAASYLFRKFYKLKLNHYLIELANSTS